MEAVLARAGIWFAILLVAVAGMALAADPGFAVHMAIVASAALAGLWISLARTDYAAIASDVGRCAGDSSTTWTARQTAS